MIRDWLHVFYDHLHLADNSPSASPNLPGFVENRYDQSIFSILCKLQGITALDGTETYAEDWEQLSSFPFQDRRDMGIPRTAKKGWLQKCRQLLLPPKKGGFGIRRQACKSERKTFWEDFASRYSVNRQTLALMSGRLLLSTRSRGSWLTEGPRL